MNLDKIFNPKSIAVIGASDEEGTVGYVLMKNLVELWHRGRIYPVNIRKKEIFNLKTYQSVSEIPETVDLAIIATPAKTVPEIVEECGKTEIKGIIIISAGFKEAGLEGRALEDKIIAIGKAYDMRIIGPNCLGVIRPSINLNATFSNKMPPRGNIAFISQSGALGTAILDWAIHSNIGFSNFVSVGSMIDVGFGDLIDYFGSDSQTRSILMYIEGIANARKFMSAARHFARTKPIVVLKSGRYSESAKAAASHTGALTGESAVYDAAFKRVGIVMVSDIAELFNCAEILGMQPNPKGPHLAIITNAGGPGVMSVDTLIAKGGAPATLSQQTIETLNKVLPPYWSKSNPIDILGDAKADRYEAVIDVCLRDNNIDGLLVIYTPQGMEDPARIARSIVEQWRSKGSQKTVLTSFMGQKEVEEANQILSKYSIPTYSTPEQAVTTYMYMYQYKRNLELLYETPEELPVDTVPPKRPLTVILRNAAKEREILTEAEAKQFLEAYTIPVVKTMVAKTVDEAASLAMQIGYPVVLKILSPQIVHKTNAGGVILDIASEAELRKAYDAIIQRAREYDPKAEIQGVTVQSMIKKQGYEIILGAKTDPLFGHVILFGMGGTGVEIFRDVAIGLPPLNQTLARRIMEETKVYEFLKGYRNAPSANLKLLEEIMIDFSQMLVDFPQLKEIDINPLLVNSKEVIALDARIVIDRKRVFEKSEPYEHLVMSPYPRKYETLWKLYDGRIVLLRPIKPEDEPMWLEMFQNFSDQSIRYRFFEIIGDTPHEIRVKYCNIDYDREIGIVAELNEKGSRKIAGVVRLVTDPDNKMGEIAIIVADPWQGLGLGTKMMDHIIEICKDKKIEIVYAEILRDNLVAIDLFRRMGFIVEALDEETVKATLNLKEEDYNDR